VARIAAHGIAAEPPRGWDAVIYQRPPQVHGVVGRALGAAPETPLPILHVANFALPGDRGDYGGGVVTGMRAGGVFAAVLQHHPAEVHEPLFAGRPPPWPLEPDHVHPDALPRRFTGGAGHQSFFVAAGRPYCLFVVIAGYPQRARLVPLVNGALATVTFT
jgi:hypothetical protein